MPFRMCPVSFQATRGRCDNESKVMNMEKEKGKILITDDEPINLKTYSRLFEKAGYKVVIASNEAETFQMLEKEKPDLLLLDKHLANEDGFDILKKINGTDVFGRVFTIIFTGKAITPDEHAEGLGLGADGYLTRPIDNTELLARVDAFLRNKKLIDKLEKSEARFRRIIEKNPDSILVVEENGKIKFANPSAENMFNIPTSELVGRDFGHPIIAGESAEIEILSKKQKNPLIGEMRTILIEWEKSISILTSIRDVTDSRRTKQMLTNLLAINNKINSQLFSEKPLETALEEIMNTIPSAEGGTVWFLDEASRLFHLQTSLGFQEYTTNEVTFDASKGIMGIVLRTKRGVLRNDIPNDPDFLADQKPPLSPKIQSLLCAPLIFRERFIGVICIDNRSKTGAFTKEDLTLLESIASHLSGVIENAHLFQQVQQHREKLHQLSNRLLVIHEEERRQVALDLHDHFGQILTTLKLSMRPESFLLKEPDQQREHIREVNNTIDELMNAIEDLSLRLRPAILDDLGIEQAVKWHIGRFEKQTGIRVTLDYDIPKGKRYPTNTEITLYRVFEECLTNASRHAKATQVHVKIKEKEQSLYLQIEDNGVGIDAAQLENNNLSGSGLPGMRERVEALQGKFDLQTAEKQGTTITIQLPIQTGKESAV